MLVNAFSEHLENVTPQHEDQDIFLRNAKLFIENIFKVVVLCVAL